ncbi:hypothetical protein L207DRAFT_520890 [Hyaloscypha variabilis F]|uniref:Uncharacterized protein n=1 Tax=Hyaloscypha variabilis (strain UAMH 11265 / GT02V1 / F) TaxID=1149755 RepID=A0A2J6QTK8_HYAVF|nr:hypothetical protein L207DRAFT_520890 [Hyaloscypha variabilis F]
MGLAGPARYLPARLSDILVWPSLGWEIGDVWNGMGRERRERRECKDGLEDGGDTCETSLICVMLWMGMLLGFFEDLQLAMAIGNFVRGGEKARPGREIA